MQNMKHKLTFIVSLGIALILTAVIGATVSLHHCMKWDGESRDIRCRESCRLRCNRCPGSGRRADRSAGQEV